MTTLTLTRAGLDLGLAGFAHKLARAFASIAAAQGAAAEYERLNACTDAQLVARGLSRTDLPGIVRDRYFA